MYENSCLFYHAFLIILYSINIVECFMLLKKKFPYLMCVCMCVHAFITSASFASQLADNIQLNTKIFIQHPTSRSNIQI